MRPRTARSTLFPYTTLFRSGRHAGRAQPVAEPGQGDAGAARPPAEAAPGRAAGAAVGRAANAGRRGRSQREDPDLRSEEHTSELQSRRAVVCRLLLEKKKNA